MAEWVSTIEAWLDAVPVRRMVVDTIRGQRDVAYLVGGAVRDAILGRKSLDLDVAVQDDAMGLARRVADRLRAAYVPLDATRDVARVVWCAGQERHHFDFAGLRAEGIVADLRARDFTINAMALPLSGEWGDLLDPTGGMGDLKARLLRAASPSAFADDPVRLLRLVRLRASLGFQVTSDTESLARVHVSNLGRVSAERMRDELVHILSLENSAQSLAYAGSLGLEAEVFPEIVAVPAGWTEALADLGRLERILGTASDDGLVRSSVSRMPEGMRRFGKRVADHLAEPLAGGRARRAVLNLGMLCHHRADTAELARRLHLSNREIRYLDTVIRSADRIGDYARERTPSMLAAHRYYRDYGADGVDGVLLAVAGKEPSALESVVAWAEALWMAWFEHRDQVVDPPQLLSGRDVIRVLEGQRGPLVGQLLAEVREAQVQGDVSDRRHALAFLKTRCEQLNKG